MTKQQRKLYLALIKRLCDLYDEYLDLPFSAKEERYVYHLKVLKVFEEIDKLYAIEDKANIEKTKNIPIVKPVSLF